jgi:hypothetical protein
LNPGLLFLLLGLAEATGGSAPADAPRQNVVLHAELKAVPRDFPVVRVLLQNRSERTAWISRRMVLNRESAGPTGREVWFDVVGPDGKAINFGCKVRAMANDPSQYMTLEPGQLFGRELNLSRCYDLQEGKKYSLTVHYQDGTLISPPPAAEPVREHLIAGPMVFEWRRAP